MSWVRQVREGFTVAAPPGVLALLAMLFGGTLLLRPFETGANVPNFGILVQIASTAVAAWGMRRFIRKRRAGNAALPRTLTGLCGAAIPAFLAMAISWIAIDFSGPFFLVTVVKVYLPALVVVAGLLDSDAVPRRPLERSVNVLYWISFPLFVIGSFADVFAAVAVRNLAKDADGVSALVTLTAWANVGVLVLGLPSWVVRFILFEHGTDQWSASS